MASINIKKDGQWTGKPVLGFKVGEENLTDELKEKIANGPDADLSDYATKEEVEALTAADVGARPANWMPSAVDVGARPDNWMPTIADIGAAPAGYGLGEAKLISMAEIDSITSPGWYYSNESATLGGYTSNRWWMQVLAYGSGATFATQRIITFNNGVGYELIHHKINGTWGELEWENPPMSVGVEYRTTERYNGKPVYAKIIDCGAMPNATMKSIAHGITNYQDIVDLRGTMTNGGTVGFLPMSAGQIKTDWNIGIVNDNIFLVTDADRSGWTAKVLIKVTKTTD